MSKSNRTTSGHQAREGRKLRAKVAATNPHAQTPEQKLARLDHRLGKGIGAVKERARLALNSSQGDT